MRKAHEDVEIDGTIGVPGLRCGDNPPEHLTPPDHRPEKRRAHTRRLEHLPKIGSLIRVREDQGALVLRHPPRMAQVDGNAQALLAACVAAASAASASALNAWTSRSVIAHLRMACPHDLLHASHFPGCKPDLDTARVEGGLREDVLHYAAGKFPGPLVVLLRNVHPQPWLDVFAILPVHALASLRLSEVTERQPRASRTLTEARVSRCARVSP